MGCFALFRLGHKFLHESELFLIIYWTHGNFFVQPIADNMF